MKNVVVFFGTGFLLALFEVKVERVKGEQLEVRVILPAQQGMAGANNGADQGQIISSSMIDWYPCY